MSIYKSKKLRVDVPLLAPFIRLALKQMLLHHNLLAVSDVDAMLGIAADTVTGEVVGWLIADYCSWVIDNLFDSAHIFQFGV